MNIVFYIFAGSNTSFFGVKKKISDQISAISKSFAVSEVVLNKSKTNLIKSLIWRLPGGSWGRDYKTALDQIKELSVGKTVSFYIRYQAADYNYIQFLSELRLNYPSANILLEIPTYPYDKELLHSLSMWPWYFKDKIYRKFIKKYVDKIVTFSEHDEIFGISTIRIINGIDVQRVAPIKENRDDEDKTIRLLAVAQFQPSHGYERVIKGIEEYYSNGGERNIELHMVGDGSEGKKYRKLAYNSGVRERIFFYGTLTGPELDSVYDNMDVGLDVFGLYKRGIKQSSSLKAREYLAKGLPVSYGTPNDVFLSGGKQFGFEYPNDNSIIDLNELISWYDQLVIENGGKNQLAGIIREFAVKNVDVSVTMRPIIDYYIENE